MYTEHAADCLSEDNGLKTVSADLSRLTCVVFAGKLS